MGTVRREHPLFVWCLTSLLWLVSAQSGFCQGASKPVPYFGAFRETGIGAIHPKGWLSEYLKRQATGLTGHLESAGYPFNSTGWVDTTLARYGWTAYEQNAYWIDGMLRCGRLIEDTTLVARALNQINYVMDHADPDGYLGPKFMKPPSALNRWPHVVFFRSMMAEYGKTHDQRIPEALRRHFLARSDSFTSHRNVINAEIMLWTYAHTHDPEMLAMARRAYDGYNATSNEVTTLERMRSDERMDGFHGVTFNETAKLAAIMYLYTGDRSLLEAVEHAYEKVDKYYMLLDGVLSSTEGMQGNGPLESHETCNIADYTWSLGYLLMATGEARYADKIERACFNAAPGAVTKDFKALQYFSCPNQMIADRTSNHNRFFHSSAWMSYRPNPGTECCPGDVNRIMPNFAARTWMEGPHGTPVAVLFAPSQYTFRSGKSKVTLIEETGYPFEEEIRFTVQTSSPVRFPLSIRIPGWCAHPEITISSEGRSSSVHPHPGTFHRIERQFRRGDVITLKLPMSLKITSWPTGGIALERGPLVYSLSIPASPEIDRLDKRSTADFPAWNLRPSGPWNYALMLRDSPIDQQVRVIRHATEGYPWEEEHVPVKLRVPARKVIGWSLDQDSAKPGVLYTPGLPTRATLAHHLADQVDTLTLVPYGCTLLRLSVFPLAGDFAGITGRTPEPEFEEGVWIAEDSITVNLRCEQPGVQLRYTLDGSDPTEVSPLLASPLTLQQSATVKARGYASETMPSFTASRSFVVLHRKPAVTGAHPSPGLTYEYYEAKWRRLPDFSTLSASGSGILRSVTLDSIQHRKEFWGTRIRGYIQIPESGFYQFILASDDGSRLIIDGERSVNNDGRHAIEEKYGYEILSAGLHTIEIQYFQADGGDGFRLEVVVPGGKRIQVPESWLWHE